MKISANKAILLFTIIAVSISLTLISSFLMLPEIIIAHTLPRYRYADSWNVHTNPFTIGGSRGTGITFDPLREPHLATIEYGNQLKENGWRQIPLKGWFLRSTEGDEYQFVKLIGPILWEVQLVLNKRFNNSISIWIDYYHEIP